MQQNIAYKRFVYNVLDKIYATNKGKADPFGWGLFGSFLDNQGIEEDIGYAKCEAAVTTVRSNEG